jgi:hypothetical protein
VTVSTHELGLEALDALVGIDALCLFVGEDERPLRGSAGFADWRMCGRLSQLLIDGFFTGKRKDALLVPSEGRLTLPRIFAVGLGNRDGFGPPALDEALSEAAEMLSKAKIRSVAMEVPGQPLLDDATRAKALLSAFVPHFEGSRVAVLAEKAFGKIIQSASAPVK